MTMATEGDATYELRDGVASLGLNRPYKRNAIDEALFGRARGSGAVRW